MIWCYYRLLFIRLVNNDDGGDDILLLFKATLLLCIKCLSHSVDLLGQLLNLSVKMLLLVAKVGFDVPVFSVEAHWPILLSNLSLLNDLSGHLLITQI